MLNQIRALLEELYLEYGATPTVVALSQLLDELILEAQLGGDPRWKNI